MPTSMKTKLQVELQLQELVIELLNSHADDENPYRVMDWEHSRTAFNVEQRGTDIVFHVGADSHRQVIPWNFDFMEPLLAYFGTGLIVKDGEWAKSGCSTCGMGAEYGYEVHVRGAKFSVSDDEETAAPKKKKAAKKKPRKKKAKR